MFTAIIEIHQCTFKCSVARLEQYMRRTAYKLFFESAIAHIVVQVLQKYVAKSPYKIKK